MYATKKICVLPILQDCWLDQMREYTHKSALKCIKFYITNEREGTRVYNSRMNWSLMEDDSLKTMDIFNS